MSCFIITWIFFFLFFFWVLHYLFFLPHPGHCGCPRRRSWWFLWGATVSHTPNRSVHDEDFLIVHQQCASSLLFQSLSVTLNLLIDVRSSAQIQSLKTCLSSFKVVRQFHGAGFMVDLNDDQGTTLNKKIRSAQLAQYNYIFGKGHYDETVCLLY